MNGTLPPPRTLSSPRLCCSERNGDGFVSPGVKHRLSPGNSSHVYVRAKRFRSCILCSGVDTCWKTIAAGLRARRTATTNDASPLVVFSTAVPLLLGKHATGPLVSGA